MPRILIAWELGEAYGHLARCLRLAHGLRQRGHTVVMALKDVRLPAASSAAQDITIVQAPLTPHLRSTRPTHSSQHSPQLNYAHVLQHCGFARHQDLAARLVAWQGIFSLARPDVLIGDHAPTALLAAHLAGIPHLSIGNGFAIPPAINPWPTIRPSESIPDQALTLAERHLDQVTDMAQKSLGYENLVRVRELFGAADVLDTFAELDHYGERLGARYVGPILSVPNAPGVDWQSETNAKVLAYLRPEVPGFVTILQGLARLDAEVLCVAPGLSTDSAKQLATRRMRISLAPVHLAALFAHANLAVSYGSSGFSTQALLAGVPLLMRPRHVEQALLAHRVQALGAGEILGGPIDVGSVTASLQALLHGSAYHQAAQAFKENYRHVCPEQALKQTLAHIEQIISGT